MQHHRLAAETGSEREPDYSVTGKGKEDNSHSCLCLNSPLFRLRCGSFMQRLLRWKCRNVLHARRGSQAFSQVRSHSTECVRCNRDKHVPKLYSSTSYSTWFRPHHPPRTSRATPAALHALAHPSHSSSRSPSQCSAFT